MHSINRKVEGDLNTSLRRKAWRKAITHAPTLNLLERDDRVFIHQSLSTPCLDVIQSCKGAKITNLQGLEYLDFHGNNVHQAGFANPFILDGIRKQMDICCFSTRRYTNETAIRCAEKITSLLPHDLTRVLFAPGGTSVIGIALKLARVISGKHKVISYYDSFHGASMDAISAGGETLFKDKLGPLLPGSLCIPPPMARGGFFKDEMQYADFLEYVIEKEGDVGAFIAEPIRNTDVQIPSPGFWQRVRKICNKHDVILILDEIALAMGRTGKMFAFENFGIEPDILCLGKGLGGGIIPFAAMIAKEEYNIADDISLGHYTHEKSPLGAAVALSTIEFIEEHMLLKKVKADERFFYTALNNLAQQHPIIHTIRGMGLLWGLELVINGKPAADQAEEVMYFCLEKGLSFKVSQGNVITLSPALTISSEELKTAIFILDEAFTALGD